MILLVVILFLSFFKLPDDYKTPISGMDKVAHVCMYAGFCIVLWFEYFRSHRVMNVKRLFVGAFLCPILFSGVVEIIQGCLTENRSADWLDFLFNVVGVSAAAVVSVFVTRPLVNRYRKG